MKWEEITVNQYYEILDILKDEVGDAIETNTRLIDCIWGIDSADIPIVKFSYYLDELKFLQDPYKPKAPKSEYTIKGIKFKPTLDVSKITTAQYIDFQELVKREEHKLLLNVLFIKDGEDYGQSDYSELLWENLTLPDYSDVMFFFLHLLDGLMTDTLNSSKKILKKMYRKEKDPQKKEELMNEMVKIHQALLAVNENGFLG